MLKVFFDVIGNGCFAVFGNFDFLRRDEPGTNLFLFGQNVREDALGSLLIATAGNKALANAATRMKQYTRKSDTVARIGGDEFAILLTEIKDKSQAMVLGKNC
jgi:hypothetical protein